MSRILLIPRPYGTEIYTILLLKVLILLDLINFKILFSCIFIFNIRYTGTYFSFLQVGYRNAT
jgi:hypothetical protein